MNVAERSLDALLEQVSKLELRVKELSEENRDLCDVCDKNGIEYEEFLAARRRRRYFDKLVVEHPIGRAATASDVLGAAPIVRGIAA